MFKTQKAYLLKDRNLVVLDKTALPNNNDSEFEDVTFAISIEQIKEWAEEIEMLGLDEEYEDEEDLEDDI